MSERRLEYTPRRPVMYVIDVAGRSAAIHERVPTVDLAQALSLYGLEYDVQTRARMMQSTCH